VLQVPASLAVALNGIIVIFVISSSRVRVRLKKLLENSSLLNKPDQEETTEAT